MPSSFSIPAFEKSISAILELHRNRSSNMLMGFWIYRSSFNHVIFWIQNESGEKKTAFRLRSKWKKDNKWKKMYFFQFKRVIVSIVKNTQTENSRRTKFLVEKNIKNIFASSSFGPRWNDGDDILHSVFMNAMTVSITIYLCELSVFNYNLSFVCVHSVITKF